MIPQQTLVPFPEFANSGTKVAPDAAKYAAGFQASDVLPAEWLNYFLNRSSAGQTALNSGAESMEEELINILTQAGLTPSAANNAQVYAAIKNFIQGNTKNVLCTSAVTEEPAVTGYGFITALYDGLEISVLFKNGHYGDDAITFNLNGLGAKKIYAPQDGALIELPPHSIDRGDSAGTQPWFMQPYTTLNLIYDSTLDTNAGGWIITENPIVLSKDDKDTGYSIRADGMNIYPSKRTEQEILRTICGTVYNLDLAGSYTVIRMRVPKGTSVYLPDKVTIIDNNGTIRTTVSMEARSESTYYDQISWYISGGDIRSSFTYYRNYNIFSA